MPQQWQATFQRERNMLYRSYDPEVLKHVQQTELEILGDFIDLCERHGIDYFGTGGTAIGAIRHQGFIPWDDDIDVGLLREDYDRFLALAKVELADKYEVLNVEEDANYPLPTTRLVKKGTVFREEALKNCRCNFGIFLDLYFFDNVPDDDKLMRKQGRWAWFWGKLLILRHVGNPTLYFGGWKAAVVRVCCRIGHFFLWLFRISPRWLYRKAMKHSQKYRNVKTKRAAFFFDPTPYTSVIVKDEVFPTKKMPFDGLDMRFPGKIEVYLKNRFGDYMTLPPEDKRHNHPPYQLDFGDGSQGI